MTNFEQKALELLESIDERLGEVLSSTRYIPSNGPLEKDDIVQAITIALSERG